MLNINQIDRTKSVSLSSLDNKNDENVTRCLIGCFDFFFIVDILDFGDDGGQHSDLF